MLLFRDCPSVDKARTRLAQQTRPGNASGGTRHHQDQATTDVVTDAEDCKASLCNTYRPQRGQESQRPSYRCSDSGKFEPWDRFRLSNRCERERSVACRVHSLDDGVDDLVLSHRFGSVSHNFSCGNEALAGKDNLPGAYTSAFLLYIPRSTILPCGHTRCKQPDRGIAVGLDHRNRSVRSQARDAFQHSKKHADVHHLLVGMVYDKSRNHFEPSFRLKLLTSNSRS